MSSAALQSGPQQPIILPSPAVSSSNRQYGPSHSSPGREPYDAHRTVASSPSSRRPSSRKTSGGGAGDSLLPVDQTVPRSSRLNTSAPLQEQCSSRAEHLANMPPVAPPRTTSFTQQPPRDQPRCSSNAEERAVEMAIPIRGNPASSSNPIHDPNHHSIRVIPNTEESNGQADHHALSQDDQDAAQPPAVSMNTSAEERRGGRSRHDHSRSHKGTTKFGDFILGNTIGEGEFGKVKLGWKQDSSVQVAIKLIKRDTVGGNPSRLGKIRREVTILRGVRHPNIVRLIDMIETDRYIGIILEYASGGELFDYILNHRYLKDHSARRLFSQLVSGVGYLHKKGIVHRDLKLENLLLDRNRNIIITDFGFANTFDPNEELTEEEEVKLGDRDHVKRMGLDKVKPNGMRIGDLMQTSCGSPCYAAPELVVSDSLYTGRKVDVWSCGVILYAMLAGYLPFDDDPANPEGDNINLLYKYIVSTPLTFPEYVTPHARDLLRRILVPNPRKRADLFEVARHSWLSEYAHVVEFITSSTTLPSDIQNATTSAQEFADAPMVTRSASVREAPKHKPPSQAGVGGLAKAHAKIDQEAESAYRTPKDTKRRTVQVEYVAPTTQTQRGRDPVVSRPPVSLNRDYEGVRPSSSRDKTLLRDSLDVHGRSSQSRRPPSAHATTSARPREVRAATDNAYMPGASAVARPQTGGSMQSAASMSLQARGNYGQPAPPAVADTNVQGRIQQPSNPDEDDAMGRTSMSVPPKFARMSGFHEVRSSESRGHKRSSTIGEIGSKLLGRSTSVFGGRNRKKPEQQQPEKSKKYPPVSMTNVLVQGEEQTGRPSIDSKMSRRSFSLGLGKKRSGSIAGSQGSGDKKERRRFSLLPASFSLKSVGLGKDYSEPASSEVGSYTDLPLQSGRLDPPRSVTAPGDARGSAPFFDNVQETDRSSPVHHQRYASTQLDNRRSNAIPQHMQSGSHFTSGSETSVEIRRPPTEPQMRSQNHGFPDAEGYDNKRATSSRGQRGVLQKNHKRFTDAYDQDDFRGHEGSSGAAKRVMDFFRRRGRARGGDER
ncbi:serine/threonine protein kinase [Metarhizium album ARSEF 1941]|uniref:non-specific serine/threonine protein kinase n=1 Tax=Metarhizium album (strain ARSEF 1941) TaxID=1081103 RepID=A0A0B2WS34_METAS|nr:serine/threonine protein kinase [Metarhizium album ARSEF 1941]KHN98891.1 serine/threonine protein kinase [Metarhizium album ARSEF 1941]